MVTAMDSLGMLTMVMEQTISTTTAMEIQQVRSCSVMIILLTIHSVTISAKMKIWGLWIQLKIVETARFTTIHSISKQVSHLFGVQLIAIMVR